MAQEMMTPEGAPAQGGGGDQSGSVVEGLKALMDGVTALADGLTKSGAPKEIVALAQQAASALSQLNSALTGGGAEPSAQDQVVA